MFSFSPVFTSNFPARAAYQVAALPRVSTGKKKNPTHLSSNKTIESSTVSQPFIKFQGESALESGVMR